MSIAFIGEKLEKTVRFNAQEISEFATLCGDHNRLHYDAEYAAGTRFGGIIASGLQTVSVWMAAIASHYAAKSAMVGLGSGFEAKRPAYPDQDIHLGWRVVSVEPKSGGREVVLLEGAVTAADGAPIVEGWFKALIGGEL